MLRWTYILLSILIGGYCIGKKRKCDIFTIYEFSSFIYFFPAYLGTVQFLGYDNQKQREYYYEGDIYYLTYIVLILNILIPFIWILLKDSQRGKILNKNFYAYKLKQRQEILVIGAEIFTLLLATICIYKNRAVLFADAFDKSLLLNEFGMLDFLAMKLAYFLFIISFSAEMKYKKTSCFFSTILIGYTLFMGARSSLVLGVISICYIWVSKQISIKSLLELIKRKKKFFLFLLLFIPIIFVGKNILPYLITFNWKGLNYQLHNKEIYIESFLHSEPNTILMNLNQILALDVNVNGASYVFSLLSVIPLIGTLSGGVLVPEDFYQLYQPIVYPFISGKWGMGSCFLGEAYSNGGFLLLIVMINVLCILFIVLDKIIFSKKSPFMRLIAMAIMPYFAFYIHRNTWAFTIQTLKYFIIFGIILYIGDCIMNMQYRQMERKEVDEEKLYTS